VAYVDEALVIYRQHVANNSGNQLRMAEGEDYVAAKAIEADPGLWTALGHERVRTRMWELAFYAGYANVESGNLVQARRYFRAATKFAPRGLRTWALWLSTFLPSGLRQELRRMKRRLVTVAGVG